MLYILLNKTVCVTFFKTVSRY